MPVSLEWVSNSSYLPSRGSSMHSISTQPYYLIAWRNFLIVTSLGMSLWRHAQHMRMALGRSPVTVRAQPRIPP
jgi:hypothetical protein